jgi:transcriptional regulator with XRE-family HTH domain
MNFRKRIKNICQKKGLTQKELAEKLGISDISLNKTLRGDYPQLQTLERIADALGVPISDLFEQPESDTVTCPKCGTKLEIKIKE